MNSMQTVLRNIGIGIVAITIITLVVGFGVDTITVAPGNVKVLLDHKYKTYAAPLCLNPNFNYETKDFEMSTYRVATTSFKYKADSACTEDEMNPTRSLIGVFLFEKIGLVKPLSYRWNEDGTWNKDYIRRS